MPEDSKKNEKKNVKEQRRPRQRHHQAKADKKLDKPEESTGAPKVPQKPPVYESPPPEFYNNLKRETDEILKITEEENSKYKKKEIQSNWSKYEVPIESYDDFEEQENLGADYEKLIETPLTAGGHFQFKHEKSWDTNTGPSPYDKYFEINMEDLNIAVNTITFFERNNIEKTLFSESDILSMDNRSTRFKQKYFKDKLFSTPESEIQNKILESIRDGMKNNDLTTKENEIYSQNDMEDCSLSDVKPTDIKLQFDTEPATVSDNNNKIEQNDFIQQNVKHETMPMKSTNSPDIDEFTHDDYIFRNPKETTKSYVENYDSPNIENTNSKLVCGTEAKVISQLETTTDVAETKNAGAVENKIAATTETKVSEAPTGAEAAKKVFESPEDLEKWLDDYLDG